MWDVYFDGYVICGMYKVSTNYMSNSHESSILMMIHGFGWQFDRLK